MSGVSDIPQVMSSIQQILASSTTYTASSSVGTSSVVVLAANPKRLGFLIYNNSANSVYIDFSPLASSSTHMVLLIATFATYQMLGPVVYTGMISAIRNAGSGILMITELIA